MNEDFYNEAIHEARAAYDRFIAEVSAINPNWVDETADQENSMEKDWGTLEFWELMLASAKMAAGMRAEDDGLNLNKLLGRSVY